MLADQSESSAPSPAQPQRLLLSLGLLGILPLIAFHWIIQSYLRIVSWPWMLGWELGFVAIFLLGIVLLRQFRYPVQLLGYGLDWFVGLFLISLLIATVFAPFPPVALWNGSRVICFLLLLYVGRNCLNDDRFHPRFSLQSLWFAVVAVGFVTSIISFSLWRPSPEMWLSNEFNDALRNHLPLGNNNFMGGYAVLWFPVTLMFPFAYGGWRRIFGIVASVMAAALLYSSGSRGALLGAIVIVSLFVLAALIHSKGKQRIIAIVSGILGFILVTGALFSNPRIRQFLVAGGINEALERIVNDGPILDRIIMLQSLGNLFQDRPLTGVGPGNMSLMYNLYRPIESGNWSMHVQQLHNTPAQILGELGIFGLLAYGGFLLYFIWINLRLYRHWQTQEQRCLVLGISISILGYATSSLTDYQLENIGIVMLLIANLWLWVGLLDEAANQGTIEPWNPPSMPGQIILKSHQLRRWISVGLLVLLGTFSVIWFPINTASALSVKATRQAIVGDLVGADQGWNLAANIVPWDPIYAVMAGQRLLDVAKTIDNPEDKQAIEDQVIEYYRQAVKAAPNDALFQQNLAVVALNKFPEEARDHALRSVELQNRDTTYAYYALGLAYLRIGETQKAIEAFVLQALNLPKILTYTLDTDPRLADIKTEVLEQSLALLQSFLASIPAETPGYSFLQEQVTIVRWWHDDLSPQELAAIPEQPFRPLIKALMLIETQPEQAIDILNTDLEANPQSLQQLSLRAWIDPDRYFEAFASALNNSRQSSAWQENFQTHRDLRDWLGSITVQEEYSQRLALWLTYRNMNSINASKILIPPGIILSRIAQDLRVYPELPRYFPQLDRLIYNYRTERLTENIEGIEGHLD
ncbi:MAG: O-antigen ligase family protein [Prochlorotrichaceae cyanobacterium]